MVIIRLLIAIVLSCGGVSVTAEAQSQLTICKNDPIPNEYLVVQRAIPWAPCGNETAMKVKKLGPREITVCDGTPQRQVPPDGYITVQKNIPTGICGSWRSGPNSWTPWTATRIRKIE